MGKKVGICFDTFKRILQYSRGAYYVQEVNKMCDLNLNLKDELLIAQRQCEKLDKLCKNLMSIKMKVAHKLSDEPLILNNLSLNDSMQE